MFNWRGLWSDESGLVVSAELVTIGTLGVLGATAGLGVVASSVNEELVDVARALRSLDQSYCVSGYAARGCCVVGDSLSAGEAGVWRAGSSYVQTDVETSLKELDKLCADWEKEADQEQEEEEVVEQELHDGSAHGGNDA